MFFFGLCFSFASAQLLKAPTGYFASAASFLERRRAASAKNEATYNSACALGDTYDVMAQNCGSNPFNDYREIDCDDADLDQEYCVEKGLAEAEQQGTELTVAKAAQMEDLLDTMASVAGTGWGASMSTTASYVASNSASTNSVSFYKAQSGDSYSLSIKYTENLKLNDAAKAKLMADPEQFVSDYGTHFISKIHYSNYFIGSVNVKQTSSTSATALSVMASIEAEDLYAVNSDTTFSEASEDSSIDVSYSTAYNGPEVYSCDECSDGPEKIADIYSQWEDNVNGEEEYAKPTRMVYSRWTELEEVQALFLEGFPDVLTQDFPSATLQYYLHIDTIRTKADLNAVTNLKSWDCVGPASSELSSDIGDIEAKLIAHLFDLEDMDVGKMADLEADILSNGLSWFVGYTGEYIGEVNELLLNSEDCQGGQDQFEEEFIIYPWGKPRWGPIVNQLRFPNTADGAFVRGFGFTVGTHHIKRVSLIGETIGYQKITSEVNGGGEHRTSKGVYKHYEGGSRDNEANFELTCAKDGMYVSGIHIQFSEVRCACATPGERNDDGNPAGYNQRQCTDGTVDWCSCTDECDQKAAYLKKNKDKLCNYVVKEKNCRRRTTEDRLRRRNSDAGYEYGRINSITVHCMPLPEGTYGLPSTTPNTHGPYTLVNQAGDLVSKDCPSGSAVYGVDWNGVARAENDNDSQTPHDAIWTLAHEVQFYCRDFDDFEA